ncbi:MAG: substrate-binding domain-containing protein [Bacteroidales bacterium]|nr:substrate-binding domain-containing protein [Bacteroidales bacterium]
MYADFYDNVDVIIESVKDNSQQQIEAIERLIKKKVDLLVISPNESTTLTPIVTKAFKAGIPVILFDRKIDNNQYTAYIGGDNFQIGQLVSNYLNTYSFRDGANLVLIRGTEGSTADLERYEGFMEGIKSGSKFNIVAQEFANFTRETAEYVMKMVLDRTPHPESINVVFAFNDRMAAGVSDAYAKYYPNLPLPMIIGVDAIANAECGVNLITDGVISASCVYPTGGSKIIETARAILLGQPYEKETNMSSFLIDQTTARLYLLQASQIQERQKLVQDLNSKISVSAENATKQERFVYVLFALILISIVALFFLIKSSRREMAINKLLNEQNAQIKEKVDEVESQKRDILSLSESLEETMQAKLAFYTNISHEFKTPLSLISGPVNDLRENKSLDEDTRNKVEILYRNSNKLNRLITELLDFRTIENDKIAINYMQGDFKAHLENISALFADAIQRRGITFQFLSDGANYVFPFDPVKIEKIFTNLMSNAFNHVDNKGRITVNLSVSGEEKSRQVVISVFNSGSFIPEEKRELIFQRFYTLDKDQKGTGIGLALTTAIVEALDGSIAVESEEKNGTTFIVKLPIHDSLYTDSIIDPRNYSPDFAKVKIGTIADEEDTDSFEEDFGNPNGPLVLVIEDNYDMRVYIKSVLKSNYKVILAKDGDEGISKAIKNIPSIILCDIMMPGKDGYEVCTALRANSVTEDIPIILLTACSMDEQISKGYECGADSYLQKPFSVRTLKVRISKLLEKEKKVQAAIKGDWLIGRDTSGLSQDSNELLGKIKTYVEEHIQDDISIDALVKYIGCSKSKFYRDIKEVTDYSTTDMVNLVRLRKAVDLMIHSHMNISDAAFNSGFSSPSYFSRIFVKYYNERPKEYIKRVTSNS